METTVPFIPASHTLHWLRTGWRAKAVVLAAMLSCLLVIVLAVDQTRITGVLGAPGRGVSGLHADRITGKPGLELISTVDAGSAAAANGLTAGMVIRYDSAFDASHARLAGDAVGLTAASNVAAMAQGHGRHIEVITRPYVDAAGSPERMIGEYSIVFAAWFSIVLGIVALVRGWRSPGAIAFAIAIFGYVGQTDAPTWANTPMLAETMLWVCGLQSAASLLLAYLPVVIYAEIVGSPGRAWKVALTLILAFCAAAVVYATWCRTHDAQLAPIGDAGPVLYVLANIGFAIGIYWAWRGRRDAAGPERQRFTALMVAYCLLIGFGLTDMVLFGLWSDTISPWLFLAIQLTSNVGIPLILAYAVLRHRVIDLGFAVNRTVVYGTVSAILLGSFGLIESGIEHLLPEEWVKASAWFDAGAAVLVYLAFHRVHDAVEHRVEHLFFHHWQENEDALRRFVGSAAHFEDARALARGFAEECGRFAGEAQVALYRRNNGALDRVAGDWDAAPRHFREDDPAFALMRAERRPLDLSDMRSSLPGVLALPMLDHGVLAGLVLLEGKGNGALYRPDEIALLGWAAHEVGLAMAALHAGQIELENRLLSAQVARLSGILGERVERAV